MSRLFFRNILVSIFISSLFALSICRAAEVSETASAPSEMQAMPLKAAESPLSLERLRAMRAEIEASATLSDVARKNALNSIELAIRLRDQISRTQKESADSSQVIKTAPARISEIGTQLKEPLLSPEEIELNYAFADMDSAGLQQVLSQESATLVNAKSKLRGLVDQIENAKGRPQHLRALVTKMNQRLTELNQELEAQAPPGEPEPVSEARRAALLIEEMKIQAEKTAWEQYLAGHDLFITLLSAERDLTSREVRNLKSRIEVLNIKAQEYREMEAQQARVDTAIAKYGSLKLPENIQDEFEVNNRLTREFEEVIKKDAAAAERIALIKAQLRDLEKNFAVSRQRVKSGIRTEAVGMALREERQSLPRFSLYRKDSATRQILMSEIQNRLLDIEHTQGNLSDLGAEASRLVGLAGPLMEKELDSIKTRLETLLKERREFLEKLSGEYERYFEKLETLEFTQQQLVTLSGEFADFLDMNLMWIRSSEILRWKDLKNVPSNLAWLIKSNQWRRVMADLRSSWELSPVVWVMGILLGGFLIIGRNRMRRGLSNLAGRVGQRGKDSFKFTFHALVITLGIAAGWPILLGLVSRQMAISPDAHEFTLGISAAGMSAAYVLLVYGFIYHVCIKQGLAQAHFGWTKAVRRTLRQNVIWLMWVIIPMVFLFYASSSVEYGDSAGRLAFILASLAISAFVGRILSKSGPIVSFFRENRPGARLILWHWFWYPMAVGLPLAIGIFAVFGYFFHTALELADRVIGTYELVFMIIIIYHLLLRWLRVAQGRLVFQEEKGESEKPGDSQGLEQIVETASQEDPDGKAIPLQAESFDLEAIDEQTLSLVRTITVTSTLIGLWLIWADVLPAIRFMADITLWSYSAEVEGLVKTFPVNLSNLLRAIIIAVISFAAARNIPGVLEITILNRLRVNHGARYAFSTVCRYVITAIGIIAVFNTLGFRWSQIQWLIAALSVGLGFGLQEIVANFISGIIVLFERPYSVGDVVTVGDTSGIVTRIRIRATTITDWDRHVLIVPNKEFITGKLVNWTLMDARERLVIRVCVAHGSDTARVKELLLKVAQEEPLVVDDPPPRALFMDFGENGFNFHLQACVGAVGDRLPGIHQLHQAIEKEFRKAGIRISLPQLDVRFEASGPLPGRREPEK